MRSDIRAVIISYGPDIERIVSKVQVNDLPVTVISARFIKPLDTEMIDEIVHMNVPVFVYQPDMESGGLASAILEYCAKKQYHVQLTSIGIHDEYVVHGAIGILRKKYGIDINSLFERVCEVTGK